jgi:hypothetical protein
VTTAQLTAIERIALQRATVAEHLQAECDHEYDRVRATFVQDDRIYFDSAAGGLHLEGVAGINQWYEILSAMLPDLDIQTTHEYDVVGCSIREVTASGTHSLEFAGVTPQGRFLTWEASLFFVFDEQEPGKILTERAYWDNDLLIKQMKGEESPPLMGLLDNPRR